MAIIDFDKIFLTIEKCCQAKREVGQSTQYCTWPKNEPHPEHECYPFWGVTSQNEHLAKQDPHRGAHVARTGAWKNEAYHMKSPERAAHIDEVSELDTVANDATFQEQASLPSWEKVLEEESKKQTALFEQKYGPPARFDHVGRREAAAAEAERVARRVDEEGHAPTTEKKA